MLPREPFDRSPETSRFPNDGPAPPLSGVDDAGPSRVVRVASFRNAAEAGYFADELARQVGLDSQITVEERFDAVTGHWSARYALYVDEASAEDAARSLSEMLAESEPEFADEARVAHAAIERSPETGVNWVPILLTLAVGSAAIWIGKKVVEPVMAGRLPPAPGHVEGQLWRQLSRGDAAWRQRSPAGLRELRFQADGTALLLEDTDGDGVFDRRARLRQPR